MRNRRCPKCRNSRLKARTLAKTGTQVDFCTECKGTWFDEHELEKALALAARELTVPDDADLTIKRCPACTSCLYQFNYPQTYVTIDLCLECRGIWLDAGEVKEIGTVRAYLENETKAIASIAPAARGVKGFLLNFINKYLDETSILS